MALKFCFRRVGFIVLGLLLVLVVGCGPSVVTMTGKVTTKGGPPVERGSIVFHPQENKAGKKYSGEIKDGQYTIQVATGNYKVTIVATKPSDPKNEYSAPMSLVATTYNTVEQTPLTANVSSSGVKDFVDLHAQ